MKLFTEHPRSWRESLFVYPVISRRSGGLSIGVNLNPDKACNFDCLYCCVDRTTPPIARAVDLPTVAAELDQLLALATSGELFNQQPFDHTPPPLRRLNDIAFSGDGEPTACPLFFEACQLVHSALAERGLADTAKIIVITNATLLHRPKVQQALDFLQSHSTENSEIWTKLDAGTEEYYRKVDRSRVPLATVLKNITNLACKRPVVIQSLFMRIAGDEPGEEEIEAYIDRLRDIREAGGVIESVQVYTVARAAADPSVSPLPADRLNTIADQLRADGFVARAFA